MLKTQICVTRPQCVNVFVVGSLLHTDCILISKIEPCGQDILAVCLYFTDIPSLGFVLRQAHSLFPTETSPQSAIYCVLFQFTVAAYVFFLVFP